MMYLQCNEALGSVVGVVIFFLHDPADAEKHAKVYVDGQCTRMHFKRV